MVQFIIPSKCYFFSRFDWCLVCIEVKRIMMKYFCQTKLIKINMCWRIVSMSNILERNKRKPVLAMNTKNAVNKRKFSNIHIVYLHSLSMTYIFLFISYHMNRKAKQISRKIEHKEKYLLWIQKNMLLSSDFSCTFMKSYCWVICTFLQNTMLVAVLRREYMAYFFTFPKYP